jgi:sugar transferase (PEP-CTERM/EpsH1 system associated)
MTSAAAGNVVPQPPLVVHVLHRFDTGGLENGVVNLINRLPAQRYRHAVVALDAVNPAFARRLQRGDVACLSVGKRPGPTLKIFPQLVSLFRQLAPAIVHTRNLVALDCQAAAWLAGVPVRIHGEHGRDVGDLDGSNRKNQWNRRLLRPFVQRWVALSQDLAATLTGPVGVPAGRVVHICNGVDSARFHRAEAGRAALADCPFGDPRLWVVGTVGRMQTVKNQTALAAAFVQVLQRQPRLRDSLRLAMVGDGPLRAASLQLLQQAGMADLAWLPGERTDVPDVMRALDCFVLPSLAEGISNTILEAMSTGLPVIAANVGGNGELVENGSTGLLTETAGVDHLADALEALALDRERAAHLGAQGRRHVERRFSLEVMVQAYDDLYGQLLACANGSTGRG